MEVVDEEEEEEEDEDEVLLDQGLGRGSLFSVPVLLLVSLPFEVVLLPAVRCEGGGGGSVLVCDDGC